MVIPNLVFCFVRCWGAAMFFLILAAVPAWLVFIGTARSIGLSDTVRRCVEEAAVAVWPALSVPIAAGLTVLRWKRVNHNMLAVGPAGLEYRHYPSPVMRLDWADVRAVRDTSIPDDDTVPFQLVIETREKRIVLDPEDWPVRDIASAIEPLFAITRHRGASEAS